jgi:hypothetical protein
MYGAPVTTTLSLLRRRTLDRKGWFRVLLAERRTAARSSLRTQ